MTMSSAFRTRAVVCLLVASAWLTTACASARWNAPRPAGPSGSATGTVEPARSAPPPADSLEVAIGKIRHLSQRARPVAKHVSGPTIETTDHRLAAALLELATVPGAAAHRRVAEEYVRLGILDAAYDHYRRALAFDARDAAAFDGLARVWRDWGLPDLGLGDARRAVYFAPEAAGVHNTLGTLLQALGQHQAARTAYERALRLHPSAAYALNNLCYLSILEGRATRAIRDCQRAIALDRRLTTAHHNLALGYAATGRLDLARRVLLAVDSVPVAHYNLGIISLARRDYASAAAAFRVSCEARPWSEPACARSRQLHVSTDEPGGELQR